MQRRFFALGTLLAAAIVSSAEAAGSDATVRAASVLGILSPVRAAANPNLPAAVIQQHIDTYEGQMRTAIKMSDPVKRNTAIGVARGNLAISTNRQLTPVAVMRIDALLGLPDSPPLLGTTQR